APPAASTYSLSLHDALPIFEQHGAISEGGSHERRILSTFASTDSASAATSKRAHPAKCLKPSTMTRSTSPQWFGSSSGESYLMRSEEHTSELQSQSNLVCRL